VRERPNADVENLALANHIVQAAHDIFHGCDAIPDVHPVQVDVVGLQSFQTASSDKEISVDPKRLTKLLASALVQPAAKPAQWVRALRFLAFFFHASY
jgi:hypothetical protein